MEIDINEIELFQKNLGFGDPFEAKIWLIGNEEAFGRGEDFLEKIKNNKLDSEIGDILVRSENDGFFTKKFSKTYSRISWKGYNIIKDYYCEDLDKLFISEFYFLPADSGNDLYDIYGGIKPKKYVNKKGEEYYPRESYYVLNNLEFLLKIRIEKIKNILDTVDNKIVYFYGNSMHKINILEEIFDKKFEIIVSGDDVIYSLNFGTNKINVIEFITYNKNYYDNSNIYDDFIKKWWKDNDNLCECGGIVLDKMNEYETTVFQCIKCGNKY